MKPLLFSCCMLLASLGHAEGFDYYTLAVTLTPAFCDLNPEQRNSVQCRERMPVNAHGLWPERSRGRAPEYCGGEPFTVSQTNEKLLRRIMPDTGLRRYQWEKHGRCSGLSADQYFSVLTSEFDGLRWPERFKAKGKDVVIERSALVAEIARLNPGVTENGVVLRCAEKERPPLLTELRFCLSREGAASACSGNPRSNCPSVVRIRAWR